MTLAQLIDQAYVDLDHPLLNIVDRPRQESLQPKRLRGGPSWVETDKFTIEAKAPVEITNPGLAGRSNRYLATLPAAMSQALAAVLEDRFKVKVHRATEQQPMYALTIAKGGLNKEKVTAPKPGDCMTIEEYTAAAAAGKSQFNDPSMRRICGRAFMFSSPEDGMEFSSNTLQQLATYLSTSMDHFVLDRTGIDGTFNFVLKPERTGGPGPGDSLDFSRTLAELGLRLEPTKGPAEYLVIDSRGAARAGQSRAGQPARAGGRSRPPVNGLVAATIVAGVLATPALRARRRGQSVRPRRLPRCGRSRRERDRELEAGAPSRPSPARTARSTSPLSTMARGRSGWRCSASSREPRRHGAAHRTAAQRHADAAAVRRHGRQPGPGGRSWRPRPTSRPRRRTIRTSSTGVRSTAPPRSFAQARAFGNNRPRTGAFYNGGVSAQLGNSAWNARPFSFGGTAAPAPSYGDTQLGFTLGGPLKIPWLVTSGPNTRIGYQHGIVHNATSQSALMPTAAERAGDFSQIAAVVRDPLTGQAFPGSMIPSSRISPQAAALLAYYPLPNTTTTGANYQTPVVAATTQDSLQVSMIGKLIRGATLAGTFAWDRTLTDSTNLFGFSDRNRQSSTNAGLTWTRRFSARFQLRLQYQFTRAGTTVTPFFAGRTNVSGDAGIAGNSQSSVDWGPPTLSFPDVAGLNDAAVSAVDRSRARRRRRGVAQAGPPQPHVRR